MHDVGESSSKRFDAAAVIGLITLAFGGYVKGSPYIQALPFSITAAAIGVVAVLVLARIMRGRYGSPQRLGLLLALLGTFAIGWPGTPWSAYTSTKMGGVFLLVPLCILGGCYLLTTDQARRWWAYGNVILGAIVAALVTLDPTLDPGGNQISEGSTRITVARAAGAGFVVLVIFATNGAKHRIACFVAAVVLASTMLDAASRGPLLASIAAVLVVAGVAPQRRRAARVVFLAAGLGGFGWWLYTSQQLAARLTTFNDVSAQARAVLWHRAWLLTESHPFGIGWGKLYENLPSNEVLAAGGGQQYPHNMLLEVSSEAGWLAIAAFLAVLVVAWRLQLRRSSTPVESAMLALFVFYLLNAMVSSDVTENRGVWVAIGAALVAMPTTPVRARAHPRCHQQLTPAEPTGANAATHVVTGSLR